MASRDTREPTEDEDIADKQERLHELRAQVEGELLQKVLSTYEGRHVLYNVIARGDIYDMDGTMPFEPAQTQRCLGRREVALETLKDCLTVEPNVYILMQQEAGAFARKFNINALGSEGENNDDGN